MSKIKLLIGPVLLIMGLILVAIPFTYEWQQAKKSAALEDALTLLKSDVEESDVTESGFTADQLNDVLELEIPSINLKQKVLNETTDENLKIALTQIKQNQTPGEGNFTIAGHRGFRGDRHFSNLPDVRVGEEIHLHDSNQTFIYKVTSSKVIQPTEVKILEDTAGENEITLITCTRSGSKRIAVKGILISTS